MDLHECDREWLKAYPMTETDRLRRQRNALAVVALGLLAILVSVGMALGN